MREWACDNAGAVRQCGLRQETKKFKAETFPLNRYRSLYTQSKTPKVNFLRFYFWSCGKMEPNLAQERRMSIGYGSSQ